MSCAKTPEAAERERIYQEGQRAFSAGDSECPYTGWKKRTWKKGYHEAKKYNEELYLRNHDHE